MQQDAEVQYYVFITVISVTSCGIAFLFSSAQYLQPITPYFQTS
jgi:hypothetical protein